MNLLATSTSNSLTSAVIYISTLSNHIHSLLDLKTIKMDSSSAAFLRRQSYREACPVDRGREETTDSSSTPPLIATLDLGSSDSGFQEIDLKDENISDVTTSSSLSSAPEVVPCSSEPSSADSSDSENGFLGFLRTIITNVPSISNLETVSRTTDISSPSDEGFIRPLSTSSSRLSLRRTMSSGSRRLGFEPDSPTTPIDLAPIPENDILNVNAQTSTSPSRTSISTSRQNSTAASTANTSTERESEEDRCTRVGGYWPHSPSALLATFTCTVGLCDICRFSYLSYQYGGGFILQFLMLTVIFGLPMLSFQMSAGQYIGSGVMDMWKVSPIFLGVGISAVLAMAVIGIYDVMPIAYMFVYFRDSFATGVTFKWGECRNAYSLDECERTVSGNLSDVFRAAVPAYYQNRVLQRLPLNGQRVGVSSSADLVFENVFNLAVIWMIVFICLSKGVKSYGKVVIVFGIFPLLTFYLLSIELLRRASSGAEFIISLNTDMSEFFFNGWSWLAAAREVFFVWGLNGFAIMQITSHNKFHHNLKRDCAIVIVLTLSILLLSAFLACACIFIIYKTQGYTYRYMPSSYETLSSSKFLLPMSELQINKNIDINNYMTVNYLLGAESVTMATDTNTYSGYQIARLATELYPMAVVVLGPKIVSAFWPVLFYLCLITFGLARQLAVWRCVVEGITAIYPMKLRPWETSITFLSCVFGFILGLPFTTQIGAFVVHFMDICVGCVWWIMIIYFGQVFGLLLVRGHPFSSDDIVMVLTTLPNMKKWLAPIISFSWNAVLPVTFLVLSITSFKLGNFGRMFSWGDQDGYEYWPSWSKQLGALVQLIPVLLIPIIALVQLLRYLFSENESGEFSERLQRLIRPGGFVAPPQHSRGSTVIELSNAAVGGDPGATASEETRDDPPPKYTPPPSYNTATGLKLLKRLNSFRMSLRRSIRSQRRMGSDDDVELHTPPVPNQTESESESPQRPVFTIGEEEMSEIAQSSRQD
ncbi:hypothetical protein CHUAL_010913 [Chamberlinius hualienensis]